jgi:Na+-driven multidrug efflux pump
LFTPDHAVQALLSGVLLLAAACQPVSGVVFVLDGVLIGAGDNRFLAVASVATTAVFAACAFAARAAGGGLTGLWLAIGAFMVARLIALGLRARSPAWTVTGAVLAPGAKPPRPPDAGFARRTS